MKTEVPDPSFFDFGTTQKAEDVDSCEFDDGCAGDLDLPVIDSNIDDRLAEVYRPLHDRRTVVQRPIPVVSNYRGSR